MKYTVFINNDGIVTNKRIDTYKPIDEICEEEYKKILESYDMAGVKYKVNSSQAFVDVVEDKVLGEDVVIGVGIGKKSTISYDVAYLKPKTVELRVSLI